MGIRVTRTATTSIIVITTAMLLGAAVLSCSSSVPRNEGTTPATTPTTSPSAQPSASPSLTVPPTPLVRPNTRPTTLPPLRVREVILEEAGQALGLVIPLPGYLPDGWMLRRVFLFEGWDKGVTLLFSDKEVTGKATDSSELREMEKQVPLAIAVRSSQEVVASAVSYWGEEKRGATVHYFPDHRSALMISATRGTILLDMEGLRFVFAGDFVSRVAGDVTDDELVKIAGSIPSVAAPGFEVQTLSVEEALRLVGNSFFLPDYVPPGFSIRGVFTRDQRKFWVIVSREPVNQKMERVSDIYDLWGQVSLGIEASDTFVITASIGGNGYTIENVNSEIMSYGGRAAYLGDTPAYAADLPYHYFFWSNLSEQARSNVFYLLAASRGIPETEVIRVAESLIK